MVTRRLAYISRGLRSGRLATSTGYSLVILVILVAIANVLVAVSLPAWSHVIRRDKEAELIFRGLQYAEAIRIFQLRFGRLPVRLEELVEVKPRSIRQLWADPMTESGEWELLHGQQVVRPQESETRAGRRRRNRRRRRSARVELQVRLEEQTATDASAEDISIAVSSRSGSETLGPVIGVHSKSLESGDRVFMGSQVYGAWLFTAELLTLPRVTPDGQRIVGSKTDWIGRPFPEGIGPKQGDVGEELGQGSLPGGINRRR